LRWMTVGCSYSSSEHAFVKGFAMKSEWNEIRSS
jgi:hypothetical protein